ncbi:MAG: YfhO family protein [Muribaculaceae bacterium]|nr:YfhO family protein [Muribaculaceae bacterium]
MNRKILYPLLATLLLAIVAVFFFFPDDVQGNVLQQHDTTQGIANGQEVKAYREASGETSRWTDSLFGGMPTFQIAPSYAASGLLGWVAKLYGLWLPAPANLLFSMMLGFFIMCLCMRFRWSNALFGAVAWGLSTYFIIIIGAGHIWKFATLSYIPPTIGGIALCYRGKYLGGTALAALFGALQILNNHIQMSYYFLFVVLFLMLAWLWEAIREKKVARWLIATVCVFGAGALAVAANSTSLYNTYEYSKETVRGRATEIVSDKGEADGAKTADGMDRNTITAWSYGIDETWTLLIPNVKGGATIKPVGAENRMMSVADTDKASDFYLTPEESQFLQQWPQYFGDQPMTNGPVYVGAFVLVLAILALFVVPGAVKWALFAVSILAIALSWGHNFPGLTDFFIDNFPMYSKFRAVSSFLVVVEFTIPLLAVLCVKKILDTPDFLARYKWTFYAVCGVPMAVCLIGWIAPSIFGQPFSINELQSLNEAGAFSNPQYANVLAAIRESRLSLVSSDCLRSFLFILLGAGVTLLYLKGAFKSKTMLACALAGVALIDLFWVNTRYVNSENFVEPDPQQAVIMPTRADEAIMADKDNYRVLDVQRFGSAEPSYFHKTIGGYHAAKLTRYNDLITHQISKNNMGVLNMLNTRYVITGGDEFVRNPDALGNAWLVDSISYVADANAEMKALDSLDTRRAAVADRKFAGVLGEAAAIQPGDTVYETRYAPNRLNYKVKSARGGIAVFSEIYFPWGWTATIDGKEAPIGRVNYVLRAMRVPAGEHNIQFEFDPQSVKTADKISTASIIVIYILCAAALAAAVIAFRRRASRQEEELK